LLGLGFILRIGPPSTVNRPLLLAFLAQQRKWSLYPRSVAAVSDRRWPVYCAFTECSFVVFHDCPLFSVAHTCISHDVRLSSV